MSSDKALPTLAPWLKWAKNGPYLPIAVDVPGHVEGNWYRQRHMGYARDPEAPGANVAPKVFYSYVNENLYPGETFWACYGMSNGRIIGAASLVAITGGMIWYAGKAKKRR